MDRAKEKAKELVNKFVDKNIYEENPTDAVAIAKTSALVCVDEMIKEHIHVSQNYKWQDEIWEWLREVKQEIEKL